MKELFKLGWRNIFRNKRRTILTSIVIGVGLASLVFQDGFLKGMLENIIHTAGNTFVGHSQIHNKDFYISNNSEAIIKNKDSVLNILKGNEKVSGYSKRIVSIAMLSSPRNSSSIRIYGVNTKDEEKVTKIKKALIEGSLDLKERSILIGEKLADLLEVHLGDHVVATVATAYTGELSQERFEITGIYSFNDPALDKNVAFIDIHKSQSLLNLGDDIHEIVIQFNSFDPLHPLNDNLKQNIENTDNEILSLNELIPSLQAILEMSKYNTVIIMAIIFLLVVFIIMNTLFMSLFERMKEFGVLKAIGTTPFQIFSLILIEAASLSVLSCFLGEALGLFINYIFSKIGISFSGIDVGGVTMTEPIYPIFSYEQISIFPAIIVIFILIVAIYPAIFAARILPVKALQRDD